MYRNVITALGLVFIAASASAQDTPAPGAPPMRMRTQTMSPTWNSDMFMTRRARLGIKVNLQARASDSVGAYIEGVTPGGPAAKAGLEAGDIITRLDGASLVGPSSADSKQTLRYNGGPGSLPGMKLIELAAKLPGGDTIKVEFRRGKDQKTVTLVTQEDPDNVFVVGPDNGRAFAYSFGDEGPEGPEGPEPWMLGPGGPGMRMRTIPDGQFRVFMSSDLEELELVPLNPDLAPYFGTTDGVLVISVPKGSTLNLKGGDVLLQIDGRTPSNTSQVHRILRSYDPGNTVKFEVMRNKKSVTVTGTIPAAPETKWKQPAGDSMKVRSSARPTTWTVTTSGDGVQAYAII